MSATKPPIIHNKLQQAIDKAIKKEKPKKNGKIKSVPIIPTEDAECFLLATYLDELKNADKIQRYTHIPNGGFRHKATANRLKALGLNGGAPDYMIILKTKMIFIEMKRIKKGVVSDNQTEWIEALRSVGIRTAVCHGYIQAQKFIESMLD